MRTTKLLFSIILFVTTLSPVAFADYEVNQPILDGLRSTQTVPKDCNCAEGSGPEDCECPNSFCGNYTSCIGSRKCVCEEGSTITYVSTSKASCSDLNTATMTCTNDGQSPVIDDIQEACDFACKAIQKEFSNGQAGGEYPCEAGPACGKKGCTPDLPAQGQPLPGNALSCRFSIVSHQKCCTASATYGCKK